MGEQLVRVFGIQPWVDDSGNAVAWIYRGTAIIFEVFVSAVRLRGCIASQQENLRISIEGVVDSSRGTSLSVCQPSNLSSEIYSGTEFRTSDAL